MRFPRSAVHFAEKNEQCRAPVIHITQIITFQLKRDPLFTAPRMAPYQRRAPVAEAAVHPFGGMRNGVFVLFYEAARMSLTDTFNDDYRSPIQHRDSQIMVSSETMPHICR